MKKKLTALLLVVTLIASLGCGTTNKGNESNVKSEEQKETSKEKTIASNEGLKGAKIGAQLLTTGHLFAEEAFKDDDTVVQAFSKGADAVAALKKGILDCVIIDEQTAKVFVDKNSDLKILDEPFETEEYAICVAKENTELLDKINQSVDTLKSNGTYQSIVDNYIGDNKGKTPYEKDANNTHENGKLFMATNAQFPPYEYYENNSIVGIDIDLANAIADLLKMELVVQDMEFDTIISSVQSGKFNMGMAGISITDERKNSVSFSEPYVSTKQVIIVKNNH